MYIYSTYEYLLDRWIRIPFQGPDGGVEAVALGTDSLILIPLEDFPVAFLALFWGVGLAVAFPLASPSLRCTGTGSGGGVINGFTVRRTGRNGGSQNRYVILEARDGCDEIIQILH
jgi:hypothetical protein